MIEQSSVTLSQLSRPEAIHRLVELGLKVKK
jgi:hypothetical protein